MKRMIDNKEFDTLKSDVNEIEAKVDNIKDIPTITIDASQMTDESHAQLTDEQYEIIENNSFINVVFPNGTSCGFNRFIDAYEDYHLAMCSGDTSEITYFTASVDSTTKIATIAIGDFSGGKKLYQHNIYLNQYGLKMTLQIINSNNTQFTLSTLKQFLQTKNFVYNVNPFPCFGAYKPAGTEDFFNMLGMNGNDMYAYNNTTGVSIADSGGDFVDTIIEL